MRRQSTKLTAPIIEEGADEDEEEDGDDFDVRDSVVEYAPETCQTMIVGHVEDHVQEGDNSDAHNIAPLRRPSAAITQGLGTGIINRAALVYGSGKRGGNVTSPARSEPASAHLRYWPHQTSFPLTW